MLNDANRHLEERLEHSVMRPGFEGHREYPMGHAYPVAI